MSWSTARQSGRCFSCNAEIYRGDRIGQDRTMRWCPACYRRKLAAETKRDDAAAHGKTTPEKDSLLWIKQSRILDSKLYISEAPLLCNAPDAASGSPRHPTGSRAMTVTARQVVCPYAYGIRSRCAPGSWTGSSPSSRSAPSPVSSPPRGSSRPSCPNPLPRPVALRYIAALHHRSTHAYRLHHPRRGRHRVAVVRARAVTTPLHSGPTPPLRRVGARRFISTAQFIYARRTILLAEAAASLGVAMMGLYLWRRRVANDDDPGLTAG